MTRDLLVVTPTLKTNTGDQNRPTHRLLEQGVWISGLFLQSGVRIFSSDFEAKNRGVNSVSSEKLLEF